VLYGNSIESYNKVIGEVASEYQCEVIDLHADKISIPTIDGSHPNKDGMTILAKLIARGILSGDCLHLDCQTDHEYVQIGGDPRKRVLMCSQCGKIKEEELS
jgi:hypothetical protein